MVSLCRPTEEIETHLVGSTMTSTSLVAFTFDALVASALPPNTGYAPDLPRNFGRFNLDAQADGRSSTLTSSPSAVATR
jgi:hypothetical protein